MNDQQLLDCLQAWTPDQVLAVHELCQWLDDTLWEQHQETLLAKYMRQEHEENLRQSDIDTDLTPVTSVSLPDDTIPF